MTISTSQPRKWIICWWCSMLHVRIRFKINMKLSPILNWIFSNNRIFLFISGCGHCTKIKPQYSEAAARVSKDKIGALGIVDATIHENLAQKFEIKGFPTLKLFQKGTFKSDYSGQRTVDDIYRFMRSNSVKNKDEL